jgi:high-affinity Fe2+/Pb2+ permease
MILFIIAALSLIAAGVLALYGWYRSSEQVSRRNERRQREERIARGIQIALDNEIT